MARRVERVSITLLMDRDEQGNLVKRLGSVSFTSYDPTPNQNAKAIDKDAYSGKAAAPAYDGNMTLDELFTAMEDICKDQGKAT